MKDESETLQKSAPETERLATAAGRERPAKRKVTGNLVGRRRDREAKSIIAGTDIGVKSERETEEGEETAINIETERGIEKRNTDGGKTETGTEREEKRRMEKGADLETVKAENLDEDLVAADSLEPRR